MVSAYPFGKFSKYEFFYGSSYILRNYFFSNMGHTPTYRHFGILTKKTPLLKKKIDKLVVVGTLTSLCI